MAVQRRQLGSGDGDGRGEDQRPVRVLVHQVATVLLGSHLGQVCASPLVHVQDFLSHDDGSMRSNRRQEPPSQWWTVMRVICGWFASERTASYVARWLR